MTTANVTWLLERDIFGENLVRLKLAIEEQGMTCVTIPNESVWYEERDWNDYLPKSTLANDPPCVIYYGSIQGGLEVNRKTNWLPGLWCDLPKFKCSSYYNKLYDELLNKDHEFVPFGLLLKRSDELYRRFGEDGCIFIRSDSGAKVFTGSVIKEERFHEDMHNLSCYDIDESEMMVVARPRMIGAEFRVVVVDGKAIACSQYKPEVIHIESPDLMEYAEKIAHIYSPERCFVVDIALTKKDLSIELVELNSFSCSGWYKCNLPAIVKAASQAAALEYDEIF